MLTKQFNFRRFVSPIHTGLLNLRISLVLFAVLSVKMANAQLTVSNYTACPNQIVSVTAQWPNTSITSLSLIIPAGGSATQNGNLQSNTSFTISHPGPGVTSWTLRGTGTNVNGPTTSTVVFYLQLDPPPALNFTNAISYCQGGTAQITTDAGGAYYTVSGTQNLGTFQTNVFVIPNLTSAHSGTYLVTSYGTCTRTGITSIQVAPNTPLTVNAASNVCQGSQVTLVANMAGGSDWQWEDQQSSPFGPPGNSVTFNAGPGDGGVYKVKVNQNFNGLLCPRSETTQVSVVAMEPVSLSASPSTVLCQGDKLTLNANANGANGYSWMGPCSFGPVTLQSPVINPILPCNGGVYTVTAFFTNGFITCSTSATQQVDVVATTPPVANVPIVICEGHTALFTATGGTNVSSWIWYGPNFSDSGPNPNTSIQGVLPNNSGPYVVTAVYQHSFSSKTCSVSSTPQQMSVIPVSSVSVIPPKPVCMPGNAYLSSSAPGASSYQWEGPNNVLMHGANATIYYPTPAASGIYTVTAFFGSLKCTSSNTVQLTVNPVLNFTLVPRQQACYNSSVQISGPPGADSYSWTSSSGKTASTRDLFFPSILPSDAGTYTLNVALGPCITKAASEIEVLTPIEFTLTPKSRTICQGDTIVMEAGVTGGSQNYAYTWHPSLYLDSPSGPYKVLVPQASVQYNVLVHDIACPSFTLGHSFDVVVKHSPVPRISFERDRGCAPLVQWYVNDTTAETGITTLDFGGLLQFQSDSIKVELKEPGEYTLRVISKGKNGCTGTWQYPYPIIVEPGPGSDIHWNPMPANTAEEVTFHATSTYDPIVYRSWHFSGGKPAVIDTSFFDGGADTTNEVSPVRRYENYGKYPVMLISENDKGCIDTVVKFVNVIDEMQVFIPDAFTPNGDGLNDNFSLKGQGLDVEGFIMDIFNRKGQIVFTTKDLNEAWDGTYRGSICPDGIYTYKIRIVGMNGEGRKEYIGRIALIK